jgi:uncharacterized protein
MPSLGAHRLLSWSRMASSSRPPTRRKPVSQQRFWVRRLGALGVVGIVCYALVQAIASSFGGDDERLVVGAPEPAGVVTCTDGDADCSPIGDEAETLAAGSTVVDPFDDAVDPVATSTTTTTEPQPENTGPPAPDNKAKVYIVGDSDAGTFGPYLEKLLDGTLIVDTELNYVVSSGLARPDFFNWPNELTAKVPEVDPDIIVVTFGGNDSQGLSLPQDELEFIIGDPVTNEAEWSEEYQRRAGEVMDILLEQTEHVIWVGIPNDDSPEVTERLAIQDRAAKAAAADRPDVVFVDTWKRFSGRDGGWAEFVVDPRDNVGKDVRADDGFHLNTNGAEILAIDIAVEVQEALRELGANI